MMKRRDFFKKAGLVIPAVTLASCGVMGDLALRSQYLIRIDQITSKLAPFLPFRQTVGGFGELVLADPVITMLPDRNKVRLGLTTGLLAGSGLGRITGVPALDQLGGRKASGRCELACGLRYDRQTRGIYLQDPEVESLEVDRFPPGFATPLLGVINLVGPRVLDRHPIHTLEPSLATRFLNSMEVQPGGIALKFAP